MPTLQQLEAAAQKAQQRYEAQRARLAEAERAARDAIGEHARIHAQVVGGAGTQSDVDQAAAARDEAIASLKAIRGELL
jgi:multidrug resistance efflux pump